MYLQKVVFVLAKTEVCPMYLVRLGVFNCACIPNFTGTFSNIMLGLEAIFCHELPCWLGDDSHNYKC